MLLSGLCGCSGHASSSTGSGSVASSAGAGGSRLSASGGEPSTAGSSAVATPSSSGTDAGSDSSTAGASGTPPLVVMPVETWGGRPLDMVPYAISGTRLTAVGYADEGAAFFGTMRDTQLGQGSAAVGTANALSGTDCAFEQLEGGDWVCSPTHQQSLIYLDSNCTEPAVEIPAATDATGTVFALASSSSSQIGGGDATLLRSKHAPVYRVAERVFESDGSTTFAEESISIYTRDVGTNCAGPRKANRHVVVSPPSIFRVTKVSDSELVRATMRRVPLKDGLSLLRLVSDDGAQLSGQLELDGRPCELQRDGRCVPAPVAERSLYADPECEEWAFQPASLPTPGATVYGVDPASDDTSRVYELTPVTTVYSQETRVDVVTTNGEPTPVVTVTGCKSLDVSGAAMTYYRRSSEVTAQLPQIGTLQLGTAALSPIWFFELLSDGKTKVQVQIHSPDGTWVRPNVRTESGQVCAVYDDRYKDQCLMKDGQSSLPVSEVKL